MPTLSAVCAGSSGFDSVVLDECMCSTGEVDASRLVELVLEFVVEKVLVNTFVFAFLEVVWQQQKHLNLLKDANCEQQQQIITRHTSLPPLLFFEVVRKPFGISTLGVA